MAVISHTHTYLPKPLVQGTQLCFAKHRSHSGLASEETATIPPRVHYKECDITITEVVVMVSWNASVVITVGIVDAKRVISICEGRRVI
jgi:hypothetical protein